MNERQRHVPSDEELVALLVQSNELAFQSIYTRYAAKLYSYARKNIPLKEDCEEIVQEVFVSIWLRRENLANITALEPYLYRMVKYKIIRYFQHSAVKKRYEEHYKLFASICDGIEDFENEPSLLQKTIDKGLADLPERISMAMRLRLSENLSNDDIAKKMNIKKIVVEKYIGIAKKHLRASYDNLI
jgi:RNA polymerase sigma factor (sigma-70 family)